LSNQLTYSESQQQLSVTSSYVGHKSPPPFMAGFIEVDIDKEKLMLGLRLREGIDQDKLTLEFVKKFDPFLTALINEGLLTKSDNTIYLTEKGLDVENQVIKYFFDAI